MTAPFSVAMHAKKQFPLYFYCECDMIVSIIYKEAIVVGRRPFSKNLNGNIPQKNLYERL